jgi:peptide/nickel transport system permease protein
MAPSIAHPLGCDDYGRDLFSRIIYGARISCIIQLGSVLVALVIGTTLGAWAGFVEGFVGGFIMRSIDVMLAFPSMLLALVVVSLLGPSLLNLILAIGITSIPGFARVAHGAVLSVKLEEFVVAARSIGEGPLSVLFRYVLPNAVSPIIVQTTMRMATVLLTASALGFLGLGISPPEPEWGTMLSSARIYIRTAPFVAIFPGVAIMTVVLGFNFLGDGLQDVLNPRLRS